MNKHRFSIFATLILVTLFVVAHYNKVIINPNNYLFDSEGDGIKNYYVYAYFIKNNIHNTNFEGMNYPYGECYLYTDCHPLIASLLKFATGYFSGIADHSIGIINFLMIISLIITALFLHLIFLELKVNKILSVFGSMAIMVLCPQLFRLSGHFALSYSCFIPITIYLLIRFENSNYKKRCFFLLFLNNLFWLFIHAYLGIIAITLLFTYGLFRLADELMNRKQLNKKNYLLLFGSLSFPIILFFSFSKIVDTHEARTTNPWGRFENHATFESIFLPTHAPFNTVANYLLPKAQQIWEGRSYIGIVSIITILFYVFVSLKKSFLRKKVVLDDSWLPDKTLRLLFLTSIIMLLFSMGCPFRINLEKLLDYMGAIKQFRALGRFAWVFYFVIAIISIYITNQFILYFVQSRKRNLRYFITICIPLIIFAEGISYHKEASASIIMSPNLFSKIQLDSSFMEAIEKIDSKKYQAILPLPFYHIGSENFTKHGNSKIQKLAILFSYHLNMPLISNYSGRTSICESKNIMQLLADNFYIKKIQKDFPNDKPFLIIYSHDELSENENYYLKEATVLVKNNAYTILELDKEEFFVNTANEEIKLYKEIENKLTLKNGFKTDDITKFIFYDDFENKPSKHSYRGIGSFQGLMKSWNILAVIEPGKLMPQINYIVRFWMYNNGNNCGQDQLNSMVFIQQRIENEVKWITPVVNPSNSMIINGNWSLIEIPFTINNSKASYELILKGNDYSDKKIYIDDILIYESKSLIYKIEKKNNLEYLFKNNHQIVSGL